MESIMGLEGESALKRGTTSGRRQRCVGGGELSAAALACSLVVAFASVARADSTQVRKRILTLTDFFPYSELLHPGAYNCEGLGRRYAEWAYPEGMAGFVDTMRAEEPDAFRSLHVLDSGSSLSGKWYLEVGDSRYDRGICFFHRDGECTPYWVGRGSAPEDHVLLVGTKFVCWTMDRDRLGKQVPPDPWSRDIHEKGDSILFRIIALNHPDNGGQVADFNAAIDSMGLDSSLSAETAIKLYLRCVYPTTTVFDLDSAQELDQYYLFLKTATRQEIENLDSTQWIGLMRPGIVPGRYLFDLPVHGHRSRPAGPLPSVCLTSKSDPWIFAIPPSHDDSAVQLTKTLFVRQPPTLFQIQFLVAAPELQIQNIQILRFVDFSRSFRRPILR